MPATDTRTRLIEAAMELAAERGWAGLSMSDIAERAGLTLADFRDAFPSKGALLGGFSRMIDRKVLDGANHDLDAESDRDRLFDVLMRRIDAMAPYKAALRSIVEWARGDAPAALALNRELVNSMRFMLEAAGIDAEGPVGAMKLQGLAFAWARILDVWFDDDEPQMDRTMAALDKALDRGGQLVRRAEDFDRFAAPLRSLARAILSGRRPEPSRERRERERARRSHDDHDDAVTAI